MWKLDANDKLELLSRSEHAQRFSRGELAFSFPKAGQPGDPGEKKQQKYTAIRDRAAFSESKYTSACEVKMKICLEPQGHGQDLAVKCLCIRRDYVQCPPFQTAQTVPSK